MGIFNSLTHGTNAQRYKLGSNIFFAEDPILDPQHNQWLLTQDLLKRCPNRQDLRIATR